MDKPESESTILARIRKKFNRGATRLFRNNCGFYTKDGYSIKYGLGVGTSDLIGWHTITITSKHLGRRLCVFTAIEVKRPGKKPSPEQVNFINAVTAAGGLAGAVTSESEVEEILDTDNWS